MSSLDLNARDQCSQRRAIKPDLLVIDSFRELAIGKVLLKRWDDRMLNLGSRMSIGVQILDADPPA